MVFCVVVFELMSGIAMDSAQMILAIPTGYSFQELNQTLDDYPGDIKQ